VTRLARLDFPNGFFHVFNRGLNKKKIFLSGSDYNYFLTKLESLLKELGHRIYCYCLLPNHYHFLIENRKEKLSKLMGRLLTSYSMYFNKKHSKNGPLFQNRFKSIVVQKESYFLELSRYIHLNPVKLGLVNKPEDYPYSSLNEIISGNKYEIVNKESVLKLIGEKKNDLKDYLNFIYQGIDLDLEEFNPFRTLKEIYGSAKFTTAQFKKM